MKSVALIAILVTGLAVSAMGQAKKEAPTAPAQHAPMPPVAPPKVETVTPKETVDSYKLLYSLEKEKNIQQQASDLQLRAMQGIEPQLQPMRTEFQQETQKVSELKEKVRKENGWGNDVDLDQNLASPTFGKWVKTPPKK